MNWKAYREIYNNLNEEEKTAMDKGLKEWLDGNDGHEEWGTTERLIAKDMFRAGWITCMAERGFFVKKKATHLFVVCINDYPHRIYDNEEKARAYTIKMNKQDEEMALLREGFKCRRYFYHLSIVGLIK